MPRGIAISVAQRELGQIDSRLTVTAYTYLTVANQRQAIEGAADRKAFSLAQ